MSGRVVTAPNAPVALTRFSRARGLAADLILVIALAWAIPLSFAAVMALITFLVNAL